MIEVHRLTKRFGPVTAVDGLVGPLHLRGARHRGGPGCRPERAGHVPHRHRRGPPDAGRPPLPDALTLSFSGFPTAQLAVAVLGVLALTAEQSTGLLRTTLVAVPRRRAVLAAKAATAGAVALAAGEVLAFASFFLTQAILSAHHRGLSLAHPGVPGAVLAGGFYLDA
jgi:hypothetical protein